MSQGVKLLVELGPVVVFFVTWFTTRDLMISTAIFIPLTLAALAYARIAAGTWPIMLLVTAIIVTVFGGLTLYLQDETFIKMKPTLIYTFFGVVLLAGLALKRYWLQLLFGSAFNLPNPAWRTLTIRWSLFFFVMAVANEIIWRNYSTDAWMVFKFPTSIIITFIFAIAQTPFVMKHQIEEPDSPGD